MTTEAVVRRLGDHLAELDEALRNARLTVCEDRPAGPGSHIVDHLDDTLTELLSLVEDGMDAVVMAVSASSGSVDVGVVRQALARCHDRHLVTGDKLRGDVLTAERHADLRRLGRDRGPAWAAWVRVTHQAFDDCVPALRLVDRDLLDCWNTLAERTAPTPIPFTPLPPPDPTD